MEQKSHAYNWDLAYANGFPCLTAKQGKEICSNCFLWVQHIVAWSCKLKASVLRSAEVSITKLYLDIRLATKEIHENVRRKVQATICCGDLAAFLYGQPRQA